MAIREKRFLCGKIFRSRKYILFLNMNKRRVDQRKRRRVERNKRT